LQEASQYQMPSTLRELFATILTLCDPHTTPKNDFCSGQKTMQKTFFNVFPSVAEVGVAVEGRLFAAFIHRCSRLFCSVF